jgi:dTDP-glucose 4,6-dehydratase
MSKHVLVTGGAGFIGHHIIDLLISETDWTIASLDRLDFSGNLNRFHEIMQNRHEDDRKRLEIVFHDLRAEINPTIANYIGKPDIILHLAAASHVDRSIEFPLEFLHDNTTGTVNLLEYARRLDDLELLLYFSTDEIFGMAPPNVFYDERARYNSTNPYSASKAAAEEFCVAYENTYQMPIFITHTMNVFGNRQTSEKFIPRCISRVHKGRKILIHSDPSKTVAGSRFYIHAADVAEAILFLINEKPSSPPDYGAAKCPKFNIVGKEEIDNLTLAKMVAEIQKKDLIYEMVDFHSSRPGHDLRYSLSGELMKSHGWEPKISFRDRIEQVSDWYLQNQKWLEP